MYNRKIKALVAIVLALVAANAVNPMLNHISQEMIVVGRAAGGLNPWMVLAGGVALSIATAGLGTIAMAAGAAVYGA
jgi:hypothetical protein